MHLKLDCTNTMHSGLLPSLFGDSGDIGCMHFWGIDHKSTKEDLNQNQQKRISINKVINKLMGRKVQEYSKNQDHTRAKEVYFFGLTALACLVVGTIYIVCFSNLQAAIQLFCLKLLNLLLYNIVI